MKEEVKELGPCFICNSKGVKLKHTSKTKWIHCCGCGVCFEHPHIEDIWNTRAESRPPSPLKREVKE